MIENQNKKTNRIDLFLLRLSDFFFLRWKQIAVVIFLILVIAGGYFAYNTIQVKKLVDNANAFTQITIQLRNEFQDIEEIDEDQFAQKQLELYREFLSSKPDYILYNQLLMEVGSLLKQLKRYEEAIEAYQEVHDTMQTDIIGKLALFNMVSLHEELGQFDQALGLLNTGNVGDFEDLRVYHLGLIELLKNNKEEAKKHFNILIRDFGNSPLKARINELLEIL